MSDKVNEALHTLARVVPTRFSGEVAVVKAEIERLRSALEEVVDDGEAYHEHYCRDIAREALRNGENQR